MRKPVALVVFLALLALTAPAAAETRVNVHNTHDCLFCHRETPRFGVDTKDTVTFRDTTADDPGLCLRCHRPEENPHPIKVKPGEVAYTAVPNNLPLGASPGLEGTVVCTTCHFVHASDAGNALLRGFPGSQKPDLFRSWQGLCRECHGENLEKRSPHAGDEKACVFCHQATPKPGQPVTMAPRGAALCNFCHGGVQNRHYEKANPFPGKLTCLSCHDPHLGADRPARLRAAYIGAATKKATIDPHYRGRSLCFTCHKEDKASPLLSEDPVALCNRCHGTGEIPADPHPLKPVSSDMKVPAGWPLKEGALTCATCHRAGHKEDKAFYRFLRGGPYADRNDICFSCHDPKAFKKRDLHLDINQLSGCGFCHAVRPVPGVDNAKTVRFLAEVDLLCLRCHDYIPHPAGLQHTTQVDAQRAKELPGKYPLFGGKITCATCHNPHLEEIEEHKLRGGVGGMEICGHCHRF